MYTVYGSLYSGNCYKIRLLLGQLEKRYLWREVDVLDGATRRPEFLAMNPQGQVPVLMTESGHYLAESGAILCYCADGSDLWPQEPKARYEILRWLFLEQSAGPQAVAQARRIVRFLPPAHPARSQLAAYQAQGYLALQKLEAHLTGRMFIVGDAYSIADIAFFSYVHCAGEGGFAMDGLRAVVAWLERIRSLPHFVAMEVPP